MNADQEVLIVTSNYPPEIGGPAKFSHEFGRWLSNKDVPCTILTTCPTSKVWNEGKIKIYGIGRNIPILVRMLRTAMLMARLGRSRKNLVCGLFYEALLARILFNFKFVAKVPSDIVWDRYRNQTGSTVDVDSYQGNERGVYAFQRFFFSKALQVAKLVIVPSVHLSQLTLRWKIRESSVSLVRNSETISPIGKPLPNDFDAVVVGRLIPLKGVDEVVKVCGKLNLTLSVVGDGPQMSDLKGIAKQSGGRVNFFGSVDNEEVMHILKRSKLFIMNSKHEGSPNALIEAMSLGMPCLVRSNPGTIELINDLENGVLVSDFRSLEEAIRMVFTDSKLLVQLGKNAQAFAAKELSKDVNFERIHQIIQ